MRINSNYEELRRNGEKCKSERNIFNNIHANHFDI